MSDGKEYPGDRFFDKFMDFMEGRSTSSVRMGLKLEHFWTVFLYNLYLTIYIFITVLVLLVVFTPLLLGSENTTFRGIGALIHVGAAVIHACHQIPYRSFIINGIQQPVCSRDVGIYLGIVAGFATIFARGRLPEFTRSLRFAVLCILPIALDGVTQTMLHLRESNNILRFVTGLIFTFGVFSFLTNRILLWKHPDFLKKITLHSITVDSVIVVLVYSIITVYFAYPLGLEYMSRQTAVDKALKASPVKPVYVESYYIAPLTPLSIQEDPYYGSHRDVILDDIRESKWAGDWLEKFNRQDVNYTLDYFNFTVDESSDYIPSNVSLREFFLTIAEKEHRFGIWAVVLLNEESFRGSAPFISKGAGEYYYYDAYTGKLISRVTHT
jgi:uncharacterized membrane protein